VFFQSGRVRKFAKKLRLLYLRIFLWRTVESWLSMLKYRFNYIRFNGINIWYISSFYQCFQFCF